MSVDSMTLWSWSHSDLLCYKDSVGTFHFSTDPHCCASCHLFNRNILKTVEPKMPNITRYLVKQDVMIHSPVLHWLHTWHFCHRSSEDDSITAALLETETGKGRRQHPVTPATIKSLQNVNCCWQRLPLGHMEIHVGWFSNIQRVNGNLYFYFFKCMMPAQISSFNTCVIDRRLLKTFPAVVVHLSSEQSLTSCSRLSSYFVCVALQGGYTQNIKEINQHQALLWGQNVDSWKVSKLPGPNRSLLRIIIP